MLDVVVGAEAEVVVLELGGRVDPAALVAAERPLLVVACDDVLPQLGAEALQEEAQVPVTGGPEDGVPLLRHVARRDDVAPIASPAALAELDAVVMGSCLDPRGEPCR